jgi:hypothetical protein
MTRLKLPESDPQEQDPGDDRELPEHDYDAELDAREEAKPPPESSAMGSGTRRLSVSVAGDF